MALAPFNIIKTRRLLCPVNLTQAWVLVETNPNSMPTPFKQTHLAVSSKGKKVLITNNRDSTRFNSIR